MPGVFPDYPAPVVRNTDTGRELAMMRWGHAAIAAHTGAAGHEHSQHVVTALAHVAQARETLPRAGQQLRGVRAPRLARNAHLILLQPSISHR